MIGRKARAVIEVIRSVQLDARTGLTWATGLLAACLGAGLLMACAPRWQEGPTDPHQGASCMRKVGSPPVSRIINYADPELCGRFVARRGPDFVRVKPKAASLLNRGS
jgi:hypothetical protein